jgi:hypothetical protein
MEAAMPMFRKKPVVIEAREFTGLNGDEILAWLDEHEREADLVPLGGTEIKAVEIPTLEGTHRADPGDMVIKGVAGEFYPCKPDIFAKTYEAVE